MHAITLLRALPLLVAFAALRGGTAEAAPATPKTVVLAPVATMGGASAKGLRKLESLVEGGIKALPQTSIITAANASRATRKAKRPELRTCDGEARCLVALGSLMGASHVVYAEVSDLGDAQVVYMKSLDVASGKELRSTTLKLSKGINRKRESKAVAAQLLAPNLYIGTLKVQTTVPGAMVFLDGHRISTSPNKPVSVYVGSHALRVTHPEHSDYVRFVDVRFEEDTIVEANLLGLPGLDQRLEAEGVLGSTSGNTTTEYRATPWYLRWYTITGGVAAIVLTSAALASGGSSISADAILDL